MEEQYFFEKKLNYLQKYDYNNIQEILCLDKFHFGFNLGINQFFSGIIVDNKITVIVRYELGTIKANTKNDISLNYLYQKQHISSNYHIDDLDKFKFDIKYIKIIYICASPTYGAKFLDIMENYYLPDIIVVKEPIKDAINFYYKNNFKSRFNDKTNCTQVQGDDSNKFIFKVPSYSPNIYSKINNKLKIDSLNDLKKENIKKIFIDNNYQHSLFSDGIIDETKMNFLINELLDNDNVNNKDINGDTIFYVLLKNKISYKYLEIFINKFKIDEESIKYLLKALEEEYKIDFKIFKLIVDKSKINSSLLEYFDKLKSEKGMTIFMIASEKGYIDMVNLLLEEKVVQNIDLQNTIGSETALIYASKGGHTDIVKILIEKGANFELKDINNFDALMYASKGGHTDIVKILIEKGANYLKRKSLGIIPPIGKNAFIPPIFSFESLTPIDIHISKRQKTKDGRKKKSIKKKSIKKKSIKKKSIKKKSIKKKSIKKKSIKKKKFA